MPTRSDDLAQLRVHAFQGIGLVFPNQLRLERPFAIARDLDRDRTVVGEHRFSTGAIAVIAGELGLGRTRRVAKLMRSSAPSARSIGAFLKRLAAVSTSSAGNP